MRRPRVNSRPVWNLRPTLLHGERLAAVGELPGLGELRRWLVLVVVADESVVHEVRMGQFPEGSLVGRSLEVTRCAYLSHAGLLDFAAGADGACARGAESPPPGPSQRGRGGLRLRRGRTREAGWACGAQAAKRRHDAEPSCFNRVRREISSGPVGRVHLSLRSLLSSAPCDHVAGVGCSSMRI